METVIRGACIFVILLVILRLSGRRTMSETTPFDFVLLLIVAETTQQALLSSDSSMTNAVILVIVLFTLDILLSYIKRLSPVLARWLNGAPTVLVRDGEPDREMMDRARVTQSDVLEAARSLQGLERMDQIRFAILEADGHLSIIPKRSKQALRTGGISR